MSSHIECVLIAGPTASGKSAVAMALARATGGVIVNADSMQVYEQLRILSARPSAAEEAETPHRLFGFADVRQPFSVARWLDAVKPVLMELGAEGRPAIVTGGTGLYFKALVEGLSAAPTSTEQGRAAARARREALGAEAFHAELVRLDPASAVLKSGDTQRTLRAWEVVTVSGRGLSVWQEAASKPLIDAERAARFVLEIDRPQLNARIDARFDLMMAAGALDEARAFWALEPDPMLPAAKTLGLPQFRRHFGGEISLNAAVADAKLQTRRFAKRQSTWFRNQTPDWTRLTVADPETMAAEIARAVGQGRAA